MANGKKPKIKGGYVIIPKTTIKCNQYKALRAPTRAVYTAILTEFIRDNKINPDNEVKITHHQMETISGVSHGAVVRAVRELKNTGFVRVVVAGGLEGNPTTWQLNGRYTNSGVFEASW
jgi:formylmethanofuran:tetrahydromethanopterin formyltransferase